MSKAILIVEDDELISFAVSLLLEEEGYTVHRAENGFAALEYMKQLHELPNLVLLDMIMPVMNGWTFAVEFMAKYDHKAPIVVMTAAADAEQRAKDVGAVAWLGKPFEMDALLALVKKYERP